MDRHKKLEGLQGERGLLAAVIAAAMVDAVGADRRARASARVYFVSDWYRHHAEYLGQPWALPAALLNECNHG